MRDPIPWKGLCFLHTKSDDLGDYYQLDPEGAEFGRLVHDRTRGHWLAYLRGCCGSASPERHGAFEDEKDVARRALNEALRRLKVRAKGDAYWLRLHKDDFS